MRRLPLVASFSSRPCAAAPPQNSARGPASRPARLSTVTNRQGDPLGRITLANARSGAERRFDRGSARCAHAQRADPPCSLPMRPVGPHWQRRCVGLRPRYAQRAPLAPAEPIGHRRLIVSSVRQLPIIRPSLHRTRASSGSLQLLGSSAFLVVTGPYQDLLLLISCWIASPIDRSRLQDGRKRPSFR